VDITSDITNFIVEGGGLAFLGNLDSRFAIWEKVFMICGRRNRANALQWIWDNYGRHYREGIG
jgi:hypothetical protein